MVGKVLGCTEKVYLEDLFSDSGNTSNNLKYFEEFSEFINFAKLNDHPKIVQSSSTSAKTSDPKRRPTFQNGECLSFQKKSASLPGR